MYESAYLKIERAKCHIVDPNALFQKQQPFTYVLDVDAKTGECATFAKKNEAVIAKCALVCGDVVHNLCSALDHVMWEIVSPFCTTDTERKKVQFPFCIDASRLDGAIKDRLIDRGAPEVRQKIKHLKPYSEGYELLYLLYEMDVLDKHKLVIPTGDYTQINLGALRQQIGGFPNICGTTSFGSNSRDVCWRGPPLTDQRIQELGIPADGKFQQKLNVPVEIVFKLGPAYGSYPVVVTLHKFVNVAQDVINYLLPSSDVDSLPTERI